MCLLFLLSLQADGSLFVFFAMASGSSATLQALQVVVNTLIPAVEPRPVPAGWYGLRVRPGRAWQDPEHRPGEAN